MPPRRVAGERAADWGALVRAGAGAGPAAGWLAGEPQAAPPAVSPATSPARSNVPGRIYFSIVIVSEPLIVSGIGSGSCGVVMASVEFELELAATSLPSDPM